MTEFDGDPLDQQRKQMIGFLSKEVTI